MKGRRTAEMEVEALNYWLTMRKLNAAYYAPGFDPETIEECARDLGDMMHASEWPLLRVRCAEAVDPACRFAGDVVA